MARVVGHGALDNDDAGKKATLEAIPKLLTLGEVRLTAIENASPNFDPTTLPPFDIIVSYMEGTAVKSYTLVGVDFTEWGNATKTDDDESVSELPFIYADQRRTR